MAASLAALALGISDPTRHLHFDAASLWLYLAALMLVATLLATAVEGDSVTLPSGWPPGSSMALWTAPPRGWPTCSARAARPPCSVRPFCSSPRSAGVTAFFCFQRALQTNRPLTAIAVMEAGATGGGVMAGFIAFGDSLGTAPGIELLHLAAFVGVGIAAWTLAPAQTRLAESAEPAGAVSAVSGGGPGPVEPVPGVAEGGGHLGAPEPPVVYSRGLRGADRDPQAP